MVPFLAIMDIKKIYNNSDSFSDITIELVNQKKIVCHKNILGGCSDVFKSMFKTQMKEKNSISILLDEDPLSIELMLMFMYNVEIKIEETSMMPLYDVSHKYNFPKLQKVCLEIINQKANKDNCCEIIGFSKLYDIKDLNEKCQKIMKESFLELKGIDKLEYDDFQELISSKETVSKDEITIFDKIVEWISYDVERQKQIYELMNLLDFSRIENKKLIYLGAIFRS